MSPLARLYKRWPPRDDLSAAELDDGLAWLVRNGVGGQMMETLSVGAFVTAYALELGATNLAIGLLAAIPHITQLLQLAGVPLADRLRNRRLLSIVAAGLSRPMFLVIAAAAFVPDSDLALLIVAIAFAVRFSFTALMSCGWNSWMRDLVPEGSMGRYFSRRLTAMTLIGIVLGLASGAFIDLWTEYAQWPARHAYAILFVGAFIGGSYSVFCMTRVPEPRMARPTGDLDLLRRLGTPFRDPNYRQLMLFLGSWNFAVNLAAPFFTVHMLKTLNIDLMTIMVLTTLSQLANVAVLRWWGTIADRLSNKSVLAVCAPLFIGCIFAWTFTTFPEPHALTMPLLVVIHVLTGIATAGVTLASGNIALKLAPRGDATTFLANNSLVNSVAAGIAPIVGGLFADFFMRRELSLTLRWHEPGLDVTFDTLSIAQWDFFFLLATLIGIFSIYRLSRIVEVGEVSERIVLNEMLLGVKRSVRNLSTIAGLISATEFPLGAARRRRHARPRPGTASTPPTGEPPATGDTPAREPDTKPPTPAGGTPGP